MSETYATYKVWDGCRAPVNLEYNGRLMGQIVREFTIDRDALLALADEMDAYSGHFSTGLQECTVQAWAVAIREALGVPDDRTTNATAC